ncbi:cytochrome c biogenesis protein CcdA [Cesiribacter andamanensis]|uniref:Thiol:disulfide interchange protein DsbD n=1 Tax=Cesiribacter andamanensis AMV16 TaxID=1279009 RepID=M7N9D9_9BACT|nr:cytochrome c biogenesis protein CcdA [Cesiribacter andamanensis]EMR03801.1 Thiol:disulfide interchange protein DsbD precursor [Cesiribacter andamanensis AMV16]
MKLAAPILFVLLMAFGLPAFAQLGQSPGSQSKMMQAPRWTVAVSPASVTQGGEAELIIRAQLPKDWYLYSSDFDPELGPTVTEFAFAPHASYQLQGGVRPIGARRKYDEIWEGEYTYFTGTAEFRQKVKVLQANPKISATVSYQICSDVTGQCIPFDTDLAIPAIAVSGTAASQQAPEEQIQPPKQGEKQPQEKSVGTGGLERQPGNTIPLEQPGAPNSSQPGSDQGSSPEPAGQDQTPAGSQPFQQAAPEVAAAEGEVPVRRLAPFDNPYNVEAEGAEKQGMWALFLVSLLAGFVALLTPCIYPMIPLTVTYFIKMGEKNRRRGVLYALGYGLSIILIYVGLGVIFAKVFGADYANELSTHWLPNLLFFFIFLLFALSFFGLFDITLPSSFVNKVDKQADRGGLIGVFFMAFALVLVGFSCTGPIAGTILIETADEIGLKSIVSMLGFSLAFALPFTLFAIFPGWLSSLPKSGGWLNSVKVVLGFLELALALKFLSVADQTYHWGLLDREVYLALWIIIFTLMGFYLLGKLRMPHDSPKQHTSVLGLIMAIGTFGFVFYLIPGLFGAP